MRSFLLTQDGDIEIGPDRNIVMVEDDDELLQAVRLQLETNLGEWFLDLEFGLDYSHIFKKRFSEDRIRAEVMKAIHQEERVARVTGYKFEFDNAARVARINFKFTKVDGGELEGEVELDV